MDDQQPPEPESGSTFNFDELPEPEPTGDPVRDRLNRMDIREVYKISKGEGPEAEAAREVLRPADEAVKAMQENARRTLQQLTDSAGFKGALAAAQDAVANSVRVNAVLQASAAGQAEQLRKQMLPNLNRAVETLRSGASIQPSLPEIAVTAPPGVTASFEGGEAREPLLSEEDLEALGAPARRQVELLDALVLGQQDLLTLQEAQAAEQVRTKAAQDKTNRLTVRWAAIAGITGILSLLLASVIAAASAWSAVGGVAGVLSLLVAGVIAVTNWW